MAAKPPGAGGVAPSQGQQPPPPPYTPYQQGPPGYYPSQVPTGSAYPSHPPPTVVMPGGFDPGARFDGIARPNIPPPPPGCAANSAQLTMYGGYAPVNTGQVFVPGYGPGVSMAYQYQPPQPGANFVVTQRPSTFWEGSGSGGWTLW